VMSGENEEINQKEGSEDPFAGGRIRVKGR